MESYPIEEFGYITGIVEYISNKPSEKDSFLIKVDLPSGLTTNYKKVIYFRNNLTAQAEVITDNRKLLDRFMWQLMNIIKR